MIDSKKESIRKIFSEFRVNDKSSYDNLYKEYYSTVYGIVFPILKNKENAEDVTQEVFMKLYNIKKENIPEKGELSWLYTVSKNEAFQYLRKNKEEINIDEIYEIKEEKNDIDKIIDNNTYNLIISPLNETEKQIVSLKILSNFTFKRIGQMLSMPTPTVQWKYYKAVNSLRISIGSFSAFLFTFIILIGRKIFKVNYKLENDEMVYENDSSIENKSEGKVNNEKEEFKDIYVENNIGESNSKINQNFTEIITNSVQDTYNFDYFEPILVGISGIFLIISIIFAIFFKNYQQKRTKKPSK